MELRGRLPLLLLLGLGLVGGACWWRERPLHPPSGVLAPEEPQQGEPEGRAPWSFQGHRLVPLATYALKARVLSRERYRFDRGAKLSPLDLALGWGPMSDSAVLDHIRITQDGRWYHWAVRSFPIPQEAIESHSANVHLIPKDRLVARELLGARVGECLELEGLLVCAEAGDGSAWQSSLTRTDTGDGSCELMWVERARRLR